MVHVNISSPINSQTFIEAGLIQRSAPSRESRDVLLILDFDDTIFPTTYLSKYDDKHALEALAKLEDRVLDLISCHSISRVAIITSASYAWVKQSIRKYMPNIYSLSLPIISATDKYSHIQDSNAYLHKLWAFSKFHQLENEENVLVIGDGLFEKYAYENMREYVSNISFIYFMPESTPKQLIRQIDLSHYALHALFEKFHPGQISLRP